MQSRGRGNVLAGYCKLTSAGGLARRCGRRFFEGVCRRIDLKQGQIAAHPNGNLIAQQAGEGFPMSTTSLDVFDRTLQKTNMWLNQIMEIMGWEDRHAAYTALRATLHALRDRLTVQEAAQLAA